MGQVIQINGDYTIKARRAGGANVMFDTGEQIGSVTVTGDLHVLGTTHTFNSQVISDVVLVLNRGETGTGVTLRRSGLEIDRGSLDRADFLFDEDVNAWTVTHKLTDGTYSYADSNLQVRKILTDASTDNGDLTLINTGTGVVKVAGTNAYETRVLDYTRLASVAITHIERSSTLHMITVTTATPHGLAINDYVDIHCATFPAFNASDKIILDRTDTTFKYADNGATFAITPVSGYVIKNSLMWIDGSSYVPTDDYIPSMRTVSDYSRSLVNAAISNFSTSHIEDQNSNVLVYDSETAGGTSYVKVTVDGIEKIRVVGTGITTPASTFDLLNENALTVNFAGAGTLINVGSGTTGTTTNLKNATVVIGNGTVSAITTPAATFNLVNDTATTVNFAGAGTLLNIGSDAVSTTTNLKNATLNVGNGIVSAITTPAATFSLVNTNAATVNFAGAGTLINIGSDAVSTTTNLKNAEVKIGNANGNASLTTPATTFNLIDDTATTVNFAGAGTAIRIGAITGKTTVRNPELSVGNATGVGSSSAITTPSETFNLINGTASTINFAGVGSTINIGLATTGTITNLKNAEVKIGNANGDASLSTPATTFNLIDSIATTVNLAGAGTTINVGSGTIGTTTNLKNSVIAVGNGTTSSITTPATTFNLVNDTATAVNLAGAGTTINVGSATAGTTTNLKNAVVAVGNGTTSSITTPATTFNLVNGTATTVNFAGAANIINIGAALPGTTTINHDLVVAGTLTFNGSNTINASTISVVDPLIFLADGNAYDSVDIGLYAAYNVGSPPNPTHPYTGLVRDASDGIWKLFSGVTDAPGITVDFTNAVYDKLKIGDLAAVKGVFTGDVSGVKGTFTGDLAVGSTFKATATTGDLTVNDLTARKGTFSGNVLTTGNITGVTITGATISGTTFTGILPAMIGGNGVYDRSTTDQKIADVAAGLAAGDVTVTITGNTGSSVDLAAATGILPVLHGGTGASAATGTGNVVLASSPVLTTPTIGVATATSINKVTITQPSANATLTLFNGSTLATNGAHSLTLKTTLDTIATFPAGDITVGYIDMPQVIQNSQGGPGLTDVGKHWFHTDSGAVTYYIDGNEPFPIGSVLTFINDSGAGDVTITATGTSLVLAGTGFVASLSVKLAADGIATAIKTTTSKWLINGVGLTVV
jgi:hypothetical protein